jgi:hypothetical protein
LRANIHNALSLDLLGFGVYTFPAGAAGAMTFHDPLEGTENNLAAYTFSASANRSNSASRASSGSTWHASRENESTTCCAT